MLFVRTVRKIKPRHVHSGIQQTVDHSRRAAGRPDGANDFRMAKVYALDVGESPCRFVLFAGWPWNSIAFFRSHLTFHFASLPRACKFGHDPRQPVDSFVK